MFNLDEKEIAELANAYLVSMYNIQWNQLPDKPDLSQANTMDEIIQILDEHIEYLNNMIH